MQQHTQHTNAAACCILIFALSLAASAASSRQGHELLVPIEQGIIELPSDWPVNVSIIDPPLHGVLSKVSPNILSYEANPDGDFWTLGSDSFGIQIPEGDGERTERVRLIAQSRTEISALNGFEAPHDEVDPAQQLEISTAGQIVGNSGLFVNLTEGSGADAYITQPIQPDFTRGGGDGGGCAEIFEEAGAADGDAEPGTGYLADGVLLNPACEVLGGCTVSILQIFDLLHSLAAFEVEMTMISAQEAAVRLVGRESGSSLSSTDGWKTDWYPISDQAHSIRIDWWPASQAAADGGAMLRVDGRVAGELRGLANQDLSMDEYRIGALDPTPGLPISYRLDHLQRYGGQFVNETAIHQMSDFEQDWAPWFVATGAGDVRRSAAAALDGSYGLEAEVGTASGWGSLLRDNTLPGTDSVTMRFSLSVDNLDLGGKLAQLLAGYHGSGVNDLIFKLDLSENQSPIDRLLNAWVKEDGEPWIQVASTELGLGKQDVEIQWRKSDHPGIANGCLRIWLAGDQQGEQCGLDIDNAALAVIRLGLMAVKAGTAGSLFLDSVEVFLPN